MNRDLYSLEANNLRQRRRRGSVWQAVFFFATIIGLIALAVLLISIIDRAFGLVAVEDAVEQSTLSDRPLEELDSPELMQILRDNLRPARLRTIERDQGSIEAMDSAALYALVITEIVKPTVEQSYYLFESLFQRGRIEAEVAQKYPDAHLEFKAWLNPTFLQNSSLPRLRLPGCARH
jgi:phosphate transport system permease protein